MVELWRVVATVICVNFICGETITDIEKVENKTKSTAYMITRFVINVAGVVYVLMNLWR